MAALIFASGPIYTGPIIPSLRASIAAAIASGEQGCTMAVRSEGSAWASRMNAVTIVLAHRDVRMGSTRPCHRLGRRDYRGHAEQDHVAVLVSATRIEMHDPLVRALFPHVHRGRHEITRHERMLELQLLVEVDPCPVQAVACPAAPRTGPPSTCPA
nr:hypothetical protein [Caballeronia sp. dw_19]